MIQSILSPLTLREVFHLEFLRRLGASLAPTSYALKGGVNMRLFFGSPRFSEDMDLDISGPSVAQLKNLVMTSLGSRAFLDPLASYGIKTVRPPDLLKAKQTETTQRFKMHILTAAGEDLFTKVEFSRRGRSFPPGTVGVDLVPDALLRPYRMTPLWVPHYDTASMTLQKINALASRAAVQARDIFDLHILISAPGAPAPATHPEIPALDAPDSTVIRKAKDRVYDVGFEMFRDTVLSYLSPEDRVAYDRPEAWDDIRLRVAGFIEAQGGRHA